MRREEAIKELKEYEDGLDLEYATPFDKAILHAIKALEQEPCEDFKQKAGVVIEQLRADRDRLATALEEIKAELHGTAEMHDDGDYYLREEWIDEVFDKHKGEE